MSDAKTAITKEDAEKRIKFISGKMPIWNTHDVLMNGILDELLGRLRDANQELKTRISNVLAASGDAGKAEELTEAISTGEAQKIMDRAKGLNANAKALVGLSNFSEMMEKKLTNFKDLLILFDGTKVSNLGDGEAIKEVMRKYGMNLQYLWKIAEEQSSSVSERQIIHKESQKA